MQLFTDTFDIVLFVTVTFLYCIPLLVWGYLSHRIGYWKGKANAYEGVIMASKKERPASRPVRHVDATVEFSDGITVDASLVRSGGRDNMVMRLLGYARSIWRQRKSQEDDTGGYRFSREEPPEPRRIVIDGKEIKPTKKVY